MQRSKNSMLMKGIQGAAVMALLSMGQTALAGSVTVRVVHAESLKPVSGVAVCLGSDRSPQSHGAMRTNAQGEVRYASSPRRNYILSVAGNGAGNYAREHTPRSFDVTYYVALANKQLTSRCLAPVQRAKSHGKAALELVAVDVKSHSHHAGTVDVATRVTGVEPTHIRVSTHEDFHDAQWMTYRQVTQHEIDHVAAKDLYVQVKRQVSQEGVDIEALSAAGVGDLHWD